MATSSVDFDHVLRMVGDQGRYQIVMFVLLCIPATVPVAFLTFSNVFTSATPDHWCKASPNMNNLNISSTDLKYLTVPYRIRSDGEKIFSKCTMYDENSTEYDTLIDVDSFKSGFTIDNDWIASFEKTISTQEIPVVKCQYGWKYDKKYYESTLVTELNLVCDDNWFPQTTTTLYYVGSIFGNILFGWVADRWGRRLAIMSLIGLEVTVSIITCFSTSSRMYLVLRTIGGLIFPALYQIPFILGIEMMGPKHRTLAGMLICMMFAMSMSLLALLAFLLKDWFTLSLATSVPFLLLFGYYWIIPESPRWLLSKGRLNEAERVLETIARFNGMTIPKKILHQLHNSKGSPEISNMNGRLANSEQYESWNNSDEKDKCQDHSATFPLTLSYKYEMKSMTAEDLKETKLKRHQTTCFSSNKYDSTETDTSPEIVVQDATLLDIFRYPNIRKKFLLLTFDWIANAVVYNGLSYNATNLGVNDFLAFFIAAVIEIPSNLLAWFLMDIWGRRWVLCMALTVGGLGCLCCMFVPEEYIWVTVTLAMIGKFGVSASFSVFYVFVSESFPTVIRSQAMGFASLLVSIGMLTFPYILQLALFSRVLPMIILGLISLSAAFASIFLPETLNTPMPQTLEDGENFGKDFKIFSMPKRRRDTETI